MKAPINAITVVVSTRNRPKAVTQAVETILMNHYTNFRAIIVDQSDNDLTETQLEPILSNPHFHYFRTDTKGISAGRNLGIAAAQSELIAITDDDCEVPADWLQELLAAFAVESRIGVVFGNVLSALHTRDNGFIPTYVRTEPFLAHRLREKTQVEGIGACMGLRRSVWQELGGFDEMLGAGAPLKSASESDFAMRSLLAGYFVYETPDVAVIHHGFRSWENGLPLIQNYLYGAGASLAKQLKCRHWAVLPILLCLAKRWLYKRTVVDLGDRYQRSLRLVSFIKGFWAGVLTPIDHARGHYLGRGASLYRGV